MGEMEPDENARGSEVHARFEVMVMIGNLINR